LALVCALLAMAGGGAGAVAGYAELSAASPTSQAAARACRGESPAASAVPPIAPAAVGVAAQLRTPVVVSSLYLAHCAWLL
jgi:hypothetical protein